MDPLQTKSEILLERLLEITTKALLGGDLSQVILRLHAIHPIVVKLSEVNESWAFDNLQHHADELFLAAAAGREKLRKQFDSNALQIATTVDNALMAMLEKNPENKPLTAAEKKAAAAKQRRATAAAAKKAIAASEASAAPATAVAAGPAPKRKAVKRKLADSADKGEAESDIEGEQKPKKRAYKKRNAPQTIVDADDEEESIQPSKHVYDESLYGADD